MVMRTMQIATSENMHKQIEFMVFNFQRLGFYVCKYTVFGCIFGFV